MTDIDAIRKRASERVNTVLASQDRRQLLLAYDAKCEELASACTLSTALSADLDAALTRISQLESRLRADLEHFRPLELGALSAFEQKYDALRAERDAAVRDANGWLRRYGSHDSDCAGAIADCTCGYRKALQHMTAALAPPTEQPKVMP